jgi:hypothetical protein
VNARVARAFTSREEQRRRNRSTRSAGAIVSTPVPDQHRGPLGRPLKRDSVVTDETLKLGLERLDFALAEAHVG